MIKKFKELVIFIIDITIFPLVLISGLLLKKIREIGVGRLKLSRYILLRIGVFPIRDHYYEPQFKFDSKRQYKDRNRNLSGLKLHDIKQLALLKQFKFAVELLQFPVEKSRNTEFYYNNGAFEYGDSEYWYQLIRTIKPKRIFEIGSGNSTLMAIKAIHANKGDDPNYKCKHICIEPYEKPWLEKIGVELYRKKVEEVPTSFFSELEENDILFIDSSHIIRPEGDVLYEYLELLPKLNKGVIVHIHDIFTPKNYPKEWVVSDVRFWNEQYLVEAFLSNNNDWEIIGALNYLKNNYFNDLKEACPKITQETEPGSLYIKKINS